MCSNNVRCVTVKDLNAVVEIHRRAFPGFLMTLMGPKFLRIYYQTLAEYSGCIFLIYEGADGPAGFVAGMCEPEGFYRTLRKRRLRALLASLFYLTFRPKIWLRVVESARQLTTRGRGQYSIGDVELASIAVDPVRSAKGVGTELLSAFLGASRGAGGLRVVLTTDASENERVNNFYLRNGFECSRQIVRTASRTMNEYIYVLSQENTSGN